MANGEKKIAIAIADANSLFIKAVKEEFNDSNLISITYVANTMVELLKLIIHSQSIPDYIVLDNAENNLVTNELNKIFDSEMFQHTKIIFSDFLLNRNSKRSYHDFDVPGTWIDSMEKKKNESMPVTNSRFYMFSHDRILRRDKNNAPIIMTNTEHLILSYLLNKFKKEDISKILGLSIDEIDLHFDNALSKL